MPTFERVLVVVAVIALMLVAAHAVWRWKQAQDRWRPAAGVPTEVVTGPRESPDRRALVEYRRSD